MLKSFGVCVLSHSFGVRVSCHSPLASVCCPEGHGERRGKEDGKEGGEGRVKNAGKYCCQGPVCGSFVEDCQSWDLACKTSIFLPVRRL